MRTAAFFAVFTFAGAAHADGFFITLNGVRVQGAQFQTTTATAPSINGVKGQTPRYSTGHLEIDDWGKLLLPSLTALNNGTRTTVTVEFTKPDARGIEQVYMTGVFQNFFVSQWEASFTPARSTNVIDFAYEQVKYTMTNVKEELPKESLTVKRGTATTPALDDSVLKGIFLPSAPHLASASITFIRVFDPMTGNVGPLKAKPVTVVRAHDTTPLTVKSVAGLDLFQKSVLRYSFEVENPTVTSVSGDTVIFTFPKAKLVDKSAGSQVAMQL